jgi:copper transport protein
MPRTSSRCTARPRNPVSHAPGVTAREGRARPVAAALAVAACLALGLVLVPRPASAHATVLSSTPGPGERLRTAPGVVVLTFSESLDIRLSHATVVAPGGRRFIQASVSSLEIRVPLTTNAPGVYQVSWTSVSALDGHTLRGGFRFGVNVSPGGAGVDEAQPGPADLALALVRGAEYAGLLLAVGLLLLLQLASLAPRVEWLRTRLVPVLALTAAAGLAVVLGEALLATGTLSAHRLGEYLGAGPARWTRAGRVLAEAAAVVVAVRGPRLAALPLAAALVALAAAGHAAATEPQNVGVAVTIVHLLSAGLWAGGILALAAQRPPDGWGSRDARRLLRRFSPVALAAFPVTAITGALEGTEELSGVRDLLTSGYGQVLALKVVAVGLMLPLSYVAWRRLATVPRLEAALALVVVGASALLAAYPLPPARLQEAQAARAGPEAALALPSGGDLTMAAGAGDVLVGLTLRPGQPGRNTAWLYVLPIGGEPAASGLRVALHAADQSPPVRRCGPACRAADVDLRGGEALTVTVPGGAATFQVPPLPAPDGRALLGSAEQRMHELRTYRLDEILLPAKVPVAVTYAFQAPDRLRYEVSGGGQAVIVGTREYTRDGAAGPWQAQTLPPVQVPSFVWDGAPAVTARLLAPEPGDAGGALQVVSFFEDQEGVPVWFQLSVDGGGVVHRATMRAQAHFMTHRYYDFDAPLTIAPP